MCYHARLLNRFFTGSSMKNAASYQSINVNMKKTLIAHAEYGGERPLFGLCDAKLEHVVIHPGESSLKQCARLEVEQCEFNGKYPFWHNEDCLIHDCIFREGGRAAIWYSRNLEMRDTLVEAPKMFRDMQGLKLQRVRMPHALETLWHCWDVQLDEVEIHQGDYLFMHSGDIRVNRLLLNGNYSFQYCRNVEIRNSELHSKDAFWNTENVTVYDSLLDGEYLGWHSKNLRLVNCRIAGTQPLCYAKGLVLENCSFAEDCDLAFEYTDLQADIVGRIHSIKNPAGGRVLADEVGEIIINEYCPAPGACCIETRN